MTSNLEVKLDFDSLKKLNAMIGSGGLVVMDENTCMVEVARFFMNFTQNESCGKCVPCREGTRRMLEILEDIQPDADYETCETLIDDGILDSFAILSIVSELQDEFGITITPADIIPENFNSAKALYAMVERLRAE